jgi:hypothetical protein
VCTKREIYLFGDDLEERAAATPTPLVPDVCILYF